MLSLRFFFCPNSDFWHVYCPNSDSDRWEVGKFEYWETVQDDMRKCIRHVAREPLMFAEALVVAVGARVAEL